MCSFYVETNSVSSAQTYNKKEWIQNGTFSPLTVGRVSGLHLFIALLLLLSVSVAFIFALSSPLGMRPSPQFISLLSVLLTAAGGLLMFVVRKTFPHIKHPSAVISIISCWHLIFIFHSPSLTDVLLLCGLNGDIHKHEYHESK